MLHSISADDSRFKTLNFDAGLNLLVADVTPVSTSTDSRNSVGKSSLVELIHFVLGARADAKHPATRRAIRGITFELQMDWPSTPNGIRVRRRGAQPGAVRVSPDPYLTHPNHVGRLAVDMVEISVAEWNKLIEAELFGLHGEHVGVSGRILLSYLARRVSAHAFNEPIRSYSRQPEAEATTNLAYLLGLDWRLADRYREIAAREATRAQLRKAVNDPVWNQIVGRTADLRGQITVAEAQVARLREQIRGFRLVPQYEGLRSRADQLARRIQELADDDVLDRRNLDYLEKAVAETEDSEVDYLEPVYAELGIVLTDQVRRRFADVLSFHNSIVRNRRHYLDDEIEAVRTRLEERHAERARLGQEQARMLESLNEGGALEALTAFQRVLAREQATLEALRNRYEAAQALEASARQITAMRVQVQQAMATDLDERPYQTSAATLLFSEYAQRLYGQGRAAYLAIEAGRSSLKITPRIDSDDSRGIGNMVIFCFDLTLAVIAHREGRGPDFLIHDSHLFDGVDDRQLALALQLAADVSAAEGMQYIATVNSDDLDKAVRRGFDPTGHVLETRLTDAYADGGLFGFRF